MTKTQTFTAAATAGVLAQSAGAAIITADFSNAPITIGPSGIIYMDLENGVASTSGVADLSARLQFDFGDSEKPFVEGSFGWNVSGSGYASKFAFGDAVSSSSSSAHYLEFYGGGWNAPNDGVGYLGFHNTFSGNQAWAKIDYNDAANTISLLAIGYNDSGAITAGQTAIPEPASAAALAALLAGGAAAFTRRRRAE